MGVGFYYRFLRVKHFAVLLLHQINKRMCTHTDGLHPQKEETILSLHRSTFELIMLISWGE